MIEFSNPSALWLLSLIIPIILLYLLKRKRQNYTVPSLLVWKKAVEDSQAQTPFQKLRSNLLLFLQILIITLITALLSQPHTSSRSRQTGSWILAIDTSASMQATDVNPDRFHAARDRLVSVLDSIPAEDEVMLISFSADASVLQPFTSNHEAVHSRLLQITPEDVGTDWKRLSLILKPLAERQPKPRIVIASDFGGYPREYQRLFPFDSLAVGRSDQNLAVTRASLRMIPDNSIQQMLFYQISNLSSSAAQTDVELSLDGELVDAASVKLQPKETMDRSRQITIAKETKIEIRLLNHDSLSLDNDFTLIANPQKPTAVQDNYKDVFLNKALSVLPAVRASTASPISIQKTSAVADDLHSGIFFVTAAEQDSAGRIIQWNTSHPTLRFVDAGIWKFLHCRALSPPPGSTVLLETDRGPVGYAVERPGMRAIVLGFDLEQTNLVEYAGFPIFLQNAIAWIQEGVEPPLQTTTDRDARKEGPHEVRSQHAFFNFADAIESNIAPQRLGMHSAPENQTMKITRSLAAYFLVLLIGMLMLEWWAFHRRLDTV